jgi:hypothetical protein
VVERTFSWIGQNRTMSKDLREADGHERGIRLRGGYDASDDEAVGSLVRLFRRFQVSICSNVNQGL